MSETNKETPNYYSDGLEYLSTLDKLNVKQKVELSEVYTGFEANNKYTIKNERGEKVFYGIEESTFRARNCYGSARPFDIKILDNHRATEIIHLQRDLNCGLCCFPCCLQSIRVYAPPDEFIGSVEQVWSCFKSKFKIKNHAGNTVLKIEGPTCIFGFVEFKILSKDETDVIGKICKQWVGFNRAAFDSKNLEYFKISFPLDLDVRMKAVILGACLLMDFMYFQRRARR